MFVIFVAKVSNLDDVLMYHTDFLNSCLKDCMLTSPELLRIVHKLMMVCVTFSNFMQVNVTVTCCENNNCYFFLHRDSLTWREAIEGRLTVKCFTVQFAVFASEFVRFNIPRDTYFIWLRISERGHLISWWRFVGVDQIMVSFCFFVFYCLGLLSFIELCIFLCRLVLFTLVISFMSKGFPYKDQIKESFIVMVYSMYSQHVPLSTYWLISLFLTATYFSKVLYSLFVLKVLLNTIQSNYRLRTQTMMNIYCTYLVFIDFLQQLSANTDVQSTAASTPSVSESVDSRKTSSSVSRYHLIRDLQIFAQT